MTDPAKLKRVDVKNIDELAFSTTTPTGQKAIIRAGQVAYTLSVANGCRIFFKGSSTFVESIEPDAAINATVNECYAALGRGYYEVPEAPPVAANQPNRAARRAVGKKK